MAFKAWSAPIFISASEVNQIDTFTTNGITSTFPCVNKTVSQIGATLQYSSTQAYLYTGGFTKNANDSVTFASTPPANLQGVIPGLGVVAVQGYDHDNVAGTTNSRVGFGQIFIGDIDDIDKYYYTGVIGSTGIELTFVNNITSVTPDLSWVQLACCDQFGNALTYAATGQPVFTTNISGFSTIAASSPANSNQLTVVSATTANFAFIPGDYIYINKGQSTAEIQRITSISYNTLTLAASTNFAHYVNEPVYDCVREFAIKQTVPINATNNTPANFYNLSINVYADTNQRL